MLINSKQFNFQFFLSGIKRVSSLESGAIENGGATEFEDGIFSNIPNGDYIRINESDNVINLFVPTTKNVDETINNTLYVNAVIKAIEDEYRGKEKIDTYKTRGSWYSEDKQKVVIEDIIIVKTLLSKIGKNDIYYFVGLAEFIKEQLSQEAVSLMINGSLCLI